MKTQDPRQDWDELLALLAPFHDQARATARRLCRSPQDGDDLFQEAVLRALGRLGTLRDRKSFRSWFFAVLLSVHRSRGRCSLWRRFFRLEEVEPEAEPAGDDGGRWEDERTRAGRMSRALSTLSSEMREAIVLFEVDGFTVEEVASMQKVSVSAVKSRLSRARERLRRHYARLGFGPASEPRIAEEMT